MSNIGSSPTLDSSNRVDSFISEHFGLMSYREMAEVLGVSKSTIGNHVRALGLTQGRADTQIKATLSRIESEPGDPGNDQLRRLYELRDMQHALLRGEISAQAFTSMSREYRETLRQIADLQRGESADLDEGQDIAGPMADLMAALPDLSSLARDAGG